MRDWFEAKTVCPGRVRAGARRLLVPVSWQGWVLAFAWSLTALLTLGAALVQGPPLFLAASLAVTLGTHAGLRLLNGLVRRG